MTLTITHPFVSPITDDLESGIVGPNDWNDVHTISGTLPAANGGYPRTRVTADVNYYVRTDGSDSNDGSANDSAHAFLTVQKAVDVIQQTLDLNLDNDWNVNINIADGTYNGTTIFGNVFNNPEDLIGDLYVRCVNVVGNVASPGNVILAGNNPVRVTGSLARWKFSGVTSIPNNVFGSAYYVAQNGYMVWEKVGATLGGAAHQQCFTVFNGGKLVGGSGATLTTSGNGDSILLCFLDATVDFEGNIVFSGTPAYGNSTANVTDGSNVWWSTGVTGSATGSRYFIAGASVIDTFGGGATAIPGDSGGTANAADGGFYL